MSFSDAAQGGVRPVAGSIRPAWLRPVALCLILALHAAALIVVRGQPTPLAPLDSVEVTLEPMGDSPEDQQKVEQATPAEAPPPAAPPTPAPQPELAAPVPELAAPVPELAAPVPELVAPESIPLPPAKPAPAEVVKPKPKHVEENNDRPTPAEAREAKREREQAAERRRKAQQARLEARRGAPEGSRSGLSSGAYAGLLAAELRRHQFYPAAAKSQGIKGSVGVAFTVGASGRVVRQSITHSSGNAALDGAARAMMSAVHTPPPPGGSFSTATSIRFDLK